MARSENAARPRQARRIALSIIERLFVSAFEGCLDLRTGE
jgi:hypothetical protein